MSGTPYLAFLTDVEKPKPNIRANTYLDQDPDTGRPHVHGFPDIMRSCEKNSEQVAYDQVAHYHCIHQQCVARCMLFPGQGRVGVS